jgi:hypothetical protein
MLQFFAFDGVLHQVTARLCLHETVEPTHVNILLCVPGEVADAEAWQGG